MDTETIDFMRDLERRYKEASSLPDRSFYKIFYGPIRPAPILVLGINPGGDPANTNPDGRTHKTGEVAAASATFYEHGEHDILDCNWRENTGLRAILKPLMGGQENLIRDQVVKTNMAFQRSATARNIDIERAKQISSPFLSEIIARVNPALVLLTGVKIDDFTSRYAKCVVQITPPEQEPRVRQIIYAASSGVLLPTNRSVAMVQVAHASQFGWTYERNQVPERIRGVLRDLARSFGDSD